MSDEIYLGTKPLRGEKHFYQWQDPHTEEGQVDKGVP